MGTRTERGRVRRRLAISALLIGGVLGGCGGGSEEADAPVEVAEERPGPGPDSPDCPVRNHLAVEFEGRTRRGLTEPIDYSFLEARPGGCHPVRFNPCEPIRYVVNAAKAPPGALDDLQEAIRRVEAASGLTFVHEGPTDEPASATRQRFQPDRYGNRWAPVLIVWDNGARHRMQPTNPAGGRSFQVDGVSVSGVLIVNVDAVAQDHGRARPANGFAEGTTWGRVFIHELGHLVGLGHVARSDQIMFAELGVQAGDAVFRPGDLEGLRLIGREAGCLPTPATPPIR